MMRPSSANGRKSAERAPTTTRASPLATACQVARRKREPISECHTAGAAPKRRSNRSSHCEDSAISGSSTSTWRPARSASATASA